MWLKFSINESALRRVAFCWDYCAVESALIMKLVKNFVYRGDLHFVGYEDVLHFRAFHFDEKNEIIEFAFSCDAQKSESYQYEGIARKSGGYSYLTDRFDPYGTSDGGVLLTFNPREFQFLTDRNEHSFLYLRASWNEDGSDWVIHGLLQG